MVEVCMRHQEMSDPRDAEASSPAGLFHGTEGSVLQIAGIDDDGSVGGMQEVAVLVPSIGEPANQI
jgi:hypothetical protein